MRDKKSAREAFTAKDARTMTPGEITDYWIRRQRYLRASGQGFYTRLRNSDRAGRVVATIDPVVVDVFTGAGLNAEGTPTDKPFED